jgi:hypothetical protein
MAARRRAGVLLTHLRSLHQMHSGSERGPLAYAALFVRTQDRL